MPFTNFLLKPLLVLAIAMPIVTTAQIGSADAKHRKHRGAAIAGAIIGGAIAYNHYKKRKKYRHYGHSRHRVVRKHHHHRHRGYYHRHSRYGHRHFHRY